jgi:hypothetical protein
MERGSTFDQEGTAIPDDTNMDTETIFPVTPDSAIGNGAEQGTINPDKREDYPLLTSLFLLSFLPAYFVSNFDALWFDRLGLLLRWEFLIVAFMLEINQKWISRYGLGKKKVSDLTMLSLLTAAFSTHCLGNYFLLCGQLLILAIIILRGRAFLAWAKGIDFYYLILTSFYFSTQLMALARVDEGLLRILGLVTLVLVLAKAVLVLIKLVCRKTDQYLWGAAFDRITFVAGYVFFVLYSLVFVAFMTVAAFYSRHSFDTVALFYMCCCIARLVSMCSKLFGAGAGRSGIAMIFMLAAIAILPALVGLVLLSFDLYGDNYVADRSSALNGTESNVQLPTVHVFNAVVDGASWLGKKTADGASVIGTHVYNKASEHAAAVGDFTSNIAASVSGAANGYAETISNGTNALLAHVSRGVDSVTRYFRGNNSTAAS